MGCFSIKRKYSGEKVLYGDSSTLWHRKSLPADSRHSNGYDLWPLFSPSSFCIHPVFYGDLVYKLRRDTGETKFISSGSKIVKRLRRRQYDQVIIERTIGLVLGPFTALYRSFLKRCTLIKKAVGTIWRTMSKPPQRRQGPDPRPLWLLVGTPSAFGPELAYRLLLAQLTLMDVPIYIFDILLYYYIC